MGSQDLINLRIIGTQQGVPTSASDSDTINVEAAPEPGQIMGAGLLLGLAGTYAMTRILTSFLFEVSPLDPFSLLLGCAALTTIGLAAALIPARRAARVDPMLTLREEG